jgi:hypothetical protein
MNKELADKCTAAKIDLAIAEADKNVSEINNKSGIINNMCF